MLVRVGKMQVVRSLLLFVSTDCGVRDRRASEDEGSEHVTCHPHDTMQQRRWPTMFLLTYHTPDLLLSLVRVPHPVPFIMCEHRCRTRQFAWSPHPTRSRPDTPTPGGNAQAMPATEALK